MALLINEACSSVRTADKIKGMARKPCLFNFLPTPVPTLPSKASLIFAEMLGQGKLA